MGLCSLRGCGHVGWSIWETLALQDTGGRGGGRGAASGRSSGRVLEGTEGTCVARGAGPPPGGREPRLALADPPWRERGSLSGLGCS